MKLTRLSEKESSGEFSLDGTYHIVVDLHLSADKKITLTDLQKKVEELGEAEIYVEKYAAKLESPFNVGDTIELAAEFNCNKDVYLDVHGNLVVSDKVATSDLEKVGQCSITLPVGTIAEINSKGSNGVVEVLFTGETIHLAELGRVAYLGILEMPSNCLKSV